MSLEQPSGHCVSCTPGHPSDLIFPFPLVTSFTCSHVGLLAGPQRCEACTTVGLCPCVLSVWNAFPLRTSSLPGMREIIKVLPGSTFSLRFPPDPLYEIATPTTSHHARIHSLSPSLTCSFSVVLVTLENFSHLFVLC